MADPGSSVGPPAPRPADLVRMLGQLRRGSAIDGPLGFLAALRELVRTPRGAPDSPLNAKDMSAAVHRDLSLPKVQPGDMAFDFQLASLDLTSGKETATGEMVRLSAYRQVSPVALIFGSYT